MVDSSSHACRLVASRQPLRRLCRCGNGSSGVCRLRLAQVVGPVAARPALQRGVAGPTALPGRSGLLGCRSRRQPRPGRVLAQRPSRVRPRFTPPVSPSSAGWLRQRHFRGLPGLGRSRPPVRGHCWRNARSRPAVCSGKHPVLLLGWCLRHLPRLLALGPGRPLTLPSISERKLSAPWSRPRSAAHPRNRHPRCRPHLRPPSAHPLDGSDHVAATARFPQAGRTAGE